MFILAETYMPKMEIGGNLLIVLVVTSVLVVRYLIARMRHREIIAAIEKLERKRLTIENIHEALDHPEKNIDFGLARAEPLILKEIIYDFNFKYFTNYLKTLHELENKIISNLLY